MFALATTSMPSIPSIFSSKAIHQLKIEITESGYLILKSDDNVEKGTFSSFEKLFSNVKIILGLTTPPYISFQPSSSPPLLGVENPLQHSISAPPFYPR